MNPSWLLVFSFFIKLGLSLSAQTQPNVVILLADDLGYKDDAYFNRVFKIQIGLCCDQKW